LEELYTMTVLRHTLTALAVSASLFGAACSAQDTGNETANNTENIVESVMPAAPEQPGQFDVTRNKAGEWFFRLIGDRGEVVLLSDTAYDAKPSALNGILAVEDAGVHAEQYEVTPISAEECSYELRALGNNQLLAQGPTFRTCAEAEAAVAQTRDLVAGVLQWKAAVTQGAQFELWKEEADGQWYFVLRNQAGNILLNSEGYTGRTGAVNGIESVRENGKQSTKYSLIQEADGSISISLKAGNGQEIAENGPYTAEAEAQAIINESVELLVSERVGSPW
jgi:uncharacterized protein YegP (UPF0339 family)